MSRKCSENGEGHNKMQTDSPCQPERRVTPLRVAEQPDPKEVCTEGRDARWRSELSGAGYLRPS
jgi:hypothetical protein